MLRVGRFSLAALAGLLSLPLASTESEAMETVIFKLPDGSGVVANGAALIAADPQIPIDVVPVNAELQSFDATEVMPLIDVDPAKLLAMREIAQERLGRPVADMTQYFRADVDADAEDLVAALLVLDAIENAYVDSGRFDVAGDIDGIGGGIGGEGGCPLADYRPNQTNLNPARPGLGVKPIHQQHPTGHRGGGITIADVEHCWILDHEDMMIATADGRVNLLQDDLGNPISWEVGDSPYDTDLDPECPPRNWVPNPYLPPAWSDNLYRDAHGAADLGILVADEDGVGIDGIVPDANILLATVDPEGGRLGIATPMLRSALSVANGGGGARVILLEICRTGARCQMDDDSPADGIPDTPADSIEERWEHVPAETRQDVYDAIVTAVGNGIHVVVAGCNGDDNLDNYFREFSCTSGTHSLRYGQLDSLGELIDSGAVMVGAATGNDPPVRWEEVGNELPPYGSNYGERIDVYARGIGVYAPGYGTLSNCPGVLGEWDFRQDWANNYRATSAATVQIAGCVGILAGDHKDLHGDDYQPSAMRLMLRTSGTRAGLPGGGSVQTVAIGRQPNLVDQIDIVEMGPQPAHVFTGFDEATGLRGPFGAAVCGIGDLDGDGVRDLLVGAPDQDSGATQNTGAVHIYSGLSGDLITSLFGPATAQAKFGTAIASGDVNGDGTDDIAIGAPGINRVFVFDGSTGPPLVQMGYSPLGTATLARNFGKTVAMGDLDADGKADIAIGAPQFNFDAIPPGGGSVFVFKGSNGAALGAPTFPFHSLANGLDRLGDSIAIGKATGGGTPYVAVGAPHILPTQPGRVLAFAAVTFNPFTPWVGAAAGDQFGAGLTTFDMLGNGNDLVAIGAPFHDTPTTTDNKGQVTVFAPGSPAVIRTLDGTVASGLFGQRLASAGNFDGDRSLSDRALEDLLVASAGEGKARVFHDSSTSSTPFRVYAGQPSSSQLGTSSAAGVGDLNGDGRSDVILGDTQAQGGNGRVYAFFAPFTCGSCTEGPYVNGGVPLVPTSACQTINGVLSECDDEWFEFNLAGGVSYQFTTCHLPPPDCAGGVAGPSTQLELVNSSCAVVAETVLPGDACVPGQPGVTLVHAPATAGTYRLHVASGNGQIGLYTLTYQEAP